MSELVLKPELQGALDESLVGLLLSIQSEQPIDFVADQATTILTDYEHRPGTRIEQFGEKLLPPNAREHFLKSGIIPYALFADVHSGMSEVREALYDAFFALATFAWRTPTKTTMSSLEGKLSHYLELRQLTEVVEANRLPEDDVQYVTLDQMAALCNRSKRTLENWLRDGKLPEPDIQGGGGKPSEWIWANVRETLAEQADRPMPRHFPAVR